MKRLLQLLSNFLLIRQTTLRKIKCLVANNFLSLWKEAKLSEYKKQQTNMENFSLRSTNTFWKFTIWRSKASLLIRYQNIKDRICLISIKMSTWYFEINKLMLRRTEATKDNIMLATEILSEEINQQEIGMFYPKLNKILNHLSNPSKCKL